MISGATSGEGGTGLGVHLENGEDNEEVCLLDARGLGGDTIKEQVAELTAGAIHGRSSRRIYHLFISPPEGWDNREDVYEDLLRRIEAELGLEGQQRASVQHVKTGAFRREHRHYVWSLVRDNGSVIRMSNDYARRERCAVETAHRFGAPCPPLAHAKAVGAALREKGLADVAAYVAASGELARDRRVASQTPRDRAIETRTGIRQADVRAAAYEAWRTSDNGAAFREALASQGLILAMGNRAPVLLDRVGTAHRLTGTVSAGAKIAGATVPAAEVHERIAGLDLPNYKASKAGSRAQAKAEAAVAAEAPAAEEPAQLTPRQERAAARAAARAGAREAGRKGRDTARATARAARSAPATGAADPAADLTFPTLADLQSVEATTAPAISEAPASVVAPAEVAAPATDADAYRGAESFERAFEIAFGPAPAAGRPVAPQQPPSVRAPAALDRGRRQVATGAPQAPVQPPRPTPAPFVAAIGADLNAPGWEAESWWTAVIAHLRAWLRGEVPEPVSPPQPATPEPPVAHLDRAAPLIAFGRYRDDAQRRVAEKRFGRIFQHAGVAEAAEAGALLVALREGTIARHWNPATLARGGSPAAVAQQRRDLDARAAQLAALEARITAAPPPTIPPIDTLWLAHCHRHHGKLFARTEGDLAKARRALDEALQKNDQREVRRWDSALSILANERHRLLCRLRAEHGGRDWKGVWADAAQAGGLLRELRERQLRAVRDERTRIAAAIRASDPPTNIGGGTRPGYIKGGGIDAQRRPVPPSDEATPLRPKG